MIRSIISSGERVAELVGVHVRLGSGVAHEVGEEALDDPVLAHDALRPLGAFGGQDRLLLLAALDEAVGLEPLQHLAGGGARNAEHLGDPRRDRRRSRRRPVLADRKGEEVDRLEVLVDGVAVRLGHPVNSSPSRPTRSASRLRRGRAIGADTTISASAGTAACEYAPTWVSFQISVASVSKPMGRRRSVAGSSFIAERKTSAAPARIPRAGERHGHATERLQRSTTEPARGLLVARAHSLERRLDSRQGLREEADDVREDEERQGLVQGRRVAGGEEDE